MHWWEGMEAVPTFEDAHWELCGFLACFNSAFKAWGQPQRKKQCSIVH